MQKCKNDPLWRGALAVVGAVFVGWVVMAAVPVVVESRDIAGSWNIVGAYDSGVSYGSIVLAGDTFCGTRSSGSDTVVFDDQRVDATGSGDTINFNNFFDSFTVMPSGLFQGFPGTICGTETSTLDTSAKVLDSAARLILRDTAPLNSILGAASDTGASAVFAALHKIANETMTLIVGVKQNSIETHQAFGAAGRDTFIGFVVLRDTVYGGGILTELIALARAGETAAGIHPLRRAGTRLDSAIGVLIESSGKGGEFLLRADTRATAAVGASLVFKDTSAVFRAAFSADTRTVTLIQDSAIAQPDTARHRQFMAFMLRPDSRLETAALFGVWRSVIVKPFLRTNGQSVLRGITGHFDFRGNGSGVFVDGGSPGLLFRDTAVSYVVATDDLSGVYPGGLNYFLVTFRPDSGAAVTARFYLEDSGRKMVIAGLTPSDSLVGIAFRPPNSLEKTVTIGAADSMVDQPGLGITVRIDSGATHGNPTISASPFDIQTMAVKGFRYLLDAEHVILGFDTVFAAFSITANTTVLGFDSITITVDVRGSSEETQGGSNLYVVVFDETSGVWTRLTGTAVDTVVAGMISFRPPHFSLFGLANLGIATSHNDRGFSCAMLGLSKRTPLIGGRALRVARGFRDALLSAPAGRLLVRGYYLSGAVILCIAIAGAAIMIAGRVSGNR